MNKKCYSVAIDGPAGAGKSTMARRAAQTLNFVKNIAKLLNAEANFQ